MKKNTVSSNRYTTQCQFVKELSPVTPRHSSRGCLLARAIRWINTSVLADWF